MNTKVYQSKYYWTKLLKQFRENRKKIIDIDIDEYNELHEYGLNNISDNKIITYNANKKLPLVSNGNGIHVNSFNTIIKNHTFENGNGIIEFENELTIIGDNAFSGCFSDTAIYAYDAIINLPSSINYIGNNAFLNCYNLKSINIPDNVTYIGDYAFKKCMSLKSINIPEGVIHIGRSAFANCVFLTSLIIPSTIQEIGIYAFCESANIKSLTIKSLTPPIILKEDNINNSIIYSTNNPIYVYNTVINNYLNNEDFNIYNIQPIQI